MIQFSTQGPVGLIQIDSTPADALGEAALQAILTALAATQNDPAVQGVIIVSHGRLSGSSADDGERHSGLSLPDVISAIEASSKPVVAAVDGVCLAGDLELALACAARVCGNSARLGFSEIELGLIPAAGGTQRLPRLIGGVRALDMIVSGELVSAEAALAIGLVDKVVPDKDLVEAGLAYVATLISQPAQPLGTKSVSDAADLQARIADLSTNRRRLGSDAARAAGEALLGSIELPFAAGLAKERALFLALKAGPQSAALNHLYLAERQAGCIDGLAPDVAPRAVEQVGIVGAGTMGSGIATAFTLAGFRVTIVDSEATALERGRSTVHKACASAAAKERVAAAEAEAAVGRLELNASLEALAAADLVIEAVYEDIALKCDIFRRLDSICRSGAILATNTSYLDVNAIAAATRRPEDVVGLHFFSPAYIMRLLEVVRGARTADDVLATAMALAPRIGKVGVLAGVCPGFIGNRMLSARQQQASALLLEGASPEQIDRLHTQFGMPMGPFQMIDLAGVDVGWHRDRTRVTNIREALCAAGRMGQKTSAGFYDYDDRRRPMPSAVTAELIERFRKEAQLPLREIDDEEIRVRTLYALVNEGAKLLAEGIAQRASDIDVVWTAGYGWPRITGGPMHWAEQVGMPIIADALEDYRDSLGPHFTIAPSLRQQKVWR